MDPITIIAAACSGLTLTALAVRDWITRPAAPRPIHRRHLAESAA